MICLYHRADLDGKGSGFLIKRFLSNSNTNIEFIGMNYGDQCDFLIEKCKNENVVMVDFVVEPKHVLLQLFDVAKTVLWIDHHISSHVMMKDVHISDRHTVILGDNSISAIEMVWNHLVSNNAPTWVQYISKYDTWHHDNNPNILAFMLGLENKAKSYDSLIWDKLYINPTDTMMSLIEDGKLLQEFVDNSNEFTVNEHAREIEFEGIKFLSINTTNKGCMQFKNHVDYDKYDFFMTYNLTKSGIWKYSLYTDRVDFDLSKIAAKYGGGGHPGACGFSSDVLLIN